MTQLISREKNSASGDPAGYLGLFVKYAQRYATGTRTQTVVTMEIHIDGIVSPAPRMIPAKTCDIAIATYPNARIRICLTPRLMISSVDVNSLIKFSPKRRSRVTKISDVVRPVSYTHLDVYKRQFVLIGFKEDEWEETLSRYFLK